MERIMGLQQILTASAKAQANWNAQMQYMGGYEAKTTYYGDFTIAELCEGIKGVKSTFNKAFKEWKSDIKYITEIALVTNHKSWEHYERGNAELSKLYSELYYKVRDYVLNHFKGEELHYYIKTTD